LPREKINNMLAYAKSVCGNASYWDRKVKRNQAFIFMINFLFLIWITFSYYYTVKLKTYPPVINIYSILTSIFIFIFIAHTVIIHINLKHPKYRKCFQLIIVIVLLIWASIFSAVDMSIGLPPYIFMFYTLLSATCLRLNMWLHSSFCIFGYCIYIFTCNYYAPSSINIFHTALIPLYAVIISIIIIIINNVSSYKKFIVYTKAEEQKKILEYYANKDFLTNIPNRKKIMEFFEEHLKNKNQNLSCIFVDIDNFKQYNDTNGHVMGDYCLKRIANILYDMVESVNGMTGRYGGEEFLVILPDKTTYETTSITEALINAVNDAKIIFNAHEENNFVTISAGIYINEKGTVITIDKAISNADAALYEVKHNGKMGHRIFNETSTPQFTTILY